MGVVARVGVCIGVGGAIVLSLFSASSPASAQSVLLDALSSRVTLAHSGGAAEDVAAEQIIRSGDTVATDSTGRAVVTYPDGSTALLEENSALTIEFVRTSAGDYAVRMRQTLGRVWYAVTRAITLGSRYEVRSAGMASVIRAGSDSYVAVSPNGETTVVTISGTVDTTPDVSAPHGSPTTVGDPGAPPLPNPPAPSTLTPSTPTSTAAPSPTSAPAPQLNTLPLTTATATPQRTSPTLPISTPKPLAAPTPVPTPLKDKYGPRKDAPGPPPPKPR